MKNPYAINFGKIPTQYIQSREIIIDTIIDDFNANDNSSQTVKLTGIRGTGKTVTLTAIEKKLKEDPDWIVIGVKSCSDIMEDIISQLYSSIPFITNYIDTSLNLSVFGIGVNISKKSPITSIDVALKMVLIEARKQMKKVLITIDEAQKTKSLIEFIQAFQIYIREELPIYLVAAGLYEDVESIENTDGLTFFLRADKYEMEPLNFTMVREDYQNTIGISFEIAEKMAQQTKGYPFAYQAFGKYMYASATKELDDSLYRYVDMALAEKVYKKIWSELAQRDKYFLKFIAEKESMTATELLEETHKNHSEWSEPRRRLSDKGIIDCSQRGQIRLLLPRFNEFIKNEIDMEKYY